LKCGDEGDFMVVIVMVVVVKESRSDGDEDGVVKM